jgi:tetratricopeptide (TPR) repeat protein
LAEETQGLRWLLAVAVLVVAGCSTGGTIRAGSVAAPPTPEAGAPAEPSPGQVDAGRPAPASPSGGASAPPPARSAAVVSLQSQAATERSAGDYERSAATLERAIRIAPQDPSLWLDLALARLAQARPDVAEGLALRAAALAGPDEAMRRRAEAVADRARRAQ